MTMTIENTTSVSLTILHKHIKWSPYKETVTEIPISAPDEDKLFSLFFRDYDKRYQYCNDDHYSIKEQDMSDKYREWYRDVRNYIKNGGDMW